MGDVNSDIVDVKGMKDSELADFLRKKAISLTLNEVKRAVSLLGRNPTLTELYIFNTQWSEHSSYKSSRSVLKKYLPIEGPSVILGPSEDSGILYLATVNGERYGLVISHESHNHPSQVVPYEGAATGIGGIVRDVLCMGARVIALADPLRFGNPFGKQKNKVRYIANGVVDGIAGYGNPLGIPNIAGDVYFNDSFDENCLVNVVCLGLVKEKDIIHSKAPKNSDGYDIIVVGKATDNSGFGGAAFASLILDEKDEESNKGAVQVPDPFLKNVLIRASEAVFEEVRKKKIPVGFKDMGAGGIMCSTSEMCDAGNFGADIDLDKVHVSMKLPPYIIANSETQERFAWVCPPSFTPTLLRIYNEDFELPNVAEGAKASVVGKVTKKTGYILRHEGKIVCNANISSITKGIKYQRASKKPLRNFKEPPIKGPADYNKILLKILNHPNVASKAKVYKHYDTIVEGLAVITPGEADAGVQAPIPGNKIGYALSVDANPRYSRIDPYLGAVNAVAEGMRNVAAVGAVPWGMTDCLNFGNPEKPEAFYDFEESVKGIAEAARKLYVKGTKNPVPFVSGNVSFYNESATGKAVDPSPVIACVGRLEDYSKAITMKLKESGSVLFLAGERKNELGGSVYYDINGEIGANVPRIDFEKERNALYSVIDAISERLVLSCHDISDGGLGTALAEMVLGGEADGKIGVSVDIGFSESRADIALFSESPGFVLEVREKDAKSVEKIFSKYKTNLEQLGRSTSEPKFIVSSGSKKLIELDTDSLAKAWTTGYGRAVE